jgi:hypothetical protein
MFRRIWTSQRGQSPRASSLQRDDSSRDQPWHSVPVRLAGSCQNNPRQVTLTFRVESNRPMRSRIDYSGRCRPTSATNPTRPPHFESTIHAKPHLLDKHIHVVSHRSDTPPQVAPTRTDRPAHAKPRQAKPTQFGKPCHYTPRHAHSTSLLSPPLAQQLCSTHHAYTGRPRPNFFDSPCLHSPSLTRRSFSEPFATFRRAQTRRNIPTTRRQSSSHLVLQTTQTCSWRFWPIRLPKPILSRPIRRTVSVLPCRTSPYLSHLTQPTRQALPSPAQSWLTDSTERAKPSLTGPIQAEPCPILANQRDGSALYKPIRQTYSIRQAISGRNLANLLYATNPSEPYRTVSTRRTLPKLIEPWRRANPNPLGQTIPAFSDRFDTPRHYRPDQDMPIRHATPSQTG